MALQQLNKLEHYFN